MKSILSGPVIVSGPINPVQNMDPGVGPSLAFQGGHLLDVRQVGGLEAGPALPGYKAYGMWCSPYVTMVDAVPITKTVGLIAAAQATTNGTAMTLAATQAAGRAINLPLIPFGSAYASANKVTPGVCLDAGFTTGTTNGTTAVLSSLPSGAWKFFKKGQRIWIAGANSATSPFFTTVAATPAAGATSITLSDIPPAAVTGGQVGNADPWGVNVAWPYAMYSPASDVAMADPTQMLGRAVSISGNAGSLAGNFTVVGYDVWGQPQSEVIAFAGGAATTNGKKAFKWITSVTPNTTDAGHLLSVDTTDIFGFTMRSDFWEYANIYWNGAFITASTGWVVADATDPATTSTGDTRGTYAVQSASDGVKRLAIFASIPMYNMINADNLSYKTLFGVTPA